MLPKEVYNKEQELLQYIETLGISKDKIFNKDLFLQLFVHKSYAADYKEITDHNERLEFLGDGILGAVINKLLFVNYPEKDESELTLYKIALVREETLAVAAKQIGLNNQIFISKGEEKMDGRNKNAILADCMEALLWYIYIDIGVEEVEQCILKYIYNQIDTISKEPIKSYKTMIQEVVQKRYKELPVYKDSESKIDDKWNPIEYKSEIYVKNQNVSEWYGSNKKKAQEEAAKKYYISLENIS